MKGTNGQEWNELVKLTGAIFEVAQAKMAGHRRRETQLRARLAELEQPQAGYSDLSDLSDPASRAGADALWQHWINCRRTELNLELAQTLVQIDGARRVLAAAHGRHQATEEIARREDAALRLKRERQSEQYG